MEDKLIKKLNGYVIRDEDAYNIANSAYSNAQSASVAATKNAIEITKIIDGSTPVAKATKADKATTATTATTAEAIKVNAQTSGLSYYVTAVQGTGDSQPIYINTNVKLGTDGSLNAVTLKEDGTELSKKYATLEALEGHTSAFVFTTRDKMLSDLKNASKTEYPIGSQLLIAEKNVPDYWVAENGGTVGTAYSAITSPQNGYTVGCYTIYELETEKVDLTGYATEDYVDNSAATIINSVNSNYIKKGQAATVECLQTDIPETGVDQRIYLTRVRNVKVTELIKPSELSNSIYTTTAEINVGLKLDNVLIESVSSTHIDFTSIPSATLSSYDPDTGIATVFVASNIQNDTIKVTLTGSQTVSPYAAIYKDNKYSYVKLYDSETEANGHYVLKEEYTSADANLNLYLAYE